MHESLSFWLNISYLLPLSCISDIQYVKIVQKVYRKVLKI